MNIEQKIFKAYDIRGLVPEEINIEVADQIGRTFASWLKTQTGREKLKIAVGRDVRTHSAELAKYLIGGLLSQSVDVVDVGLISTPMLYFISGSTNFDGGIAVTASHNPAEYNGFKLVRERAIAISGDSGIKEIGQQAVSQNYPDREPGELTSQSFLDSYLIHLSSLVNFESLAEKKIVVNPNFGANAMVMKRIASDLPGQFLYLNEQLDGTFPKGTPDPMLLGNRQETADLVRSTGADFGVSWDADGDRAFFFDEEGNFVDGYFGTALLAEALLIENPGSKIIHDPRLVWAVQDIVRENGGTAFVNRVGHSFFKERMRRENAIFAGEMSGHYYFRDNFYADDGFLAFLYIWQLISKKSCCFSELISPLRQKYFTPGRELNFVYSQPERLIADVKSRYSAGRIEEIDGLSVEFPDWRFNLRMSRTEPLLRLNIEARSFNSLEQNLNNLVSLISSLGAEEKKS